jgi:tRNA(Ile)-lysidine synthase
MIALNVGCSGAMNWIQTKTNLLRTFPLDGRYLIGVSGGRDSVALLHWLFNAGYKSLVICHLNHRLRGRSSDADARFVKGLARKYRLDFQLGAADVRALAKRRKISIETAARDARYSFFAKTAARRRCRMILLGHHADDLVETFLINLFRGSGTAGLAAMREMSTRCVDGIDLAIVRPLLGVWRKEIDDYVHEHGLTFREDASNKNFDSLRNRIRHRIIPNLEKIFGRNIRPAIWRAATIAGEEEAWMDGQLPDSSDIELSVAKLRALPVALQRRAIFKWLRAQKVSEVGFEVIERVRSLIDPTAQVAKVNLAQARHARRRSRKIFIE